jgi:hypothetical protein
MEFKVRHGHCDIPTVLKENPKLGRFVNSMRTQRKRGALSAKREAQLNEIGFVWASRNKMEREAGQSNRKEPSTIKVVIDWSRNGYQYGTETFCEQLASDTLVSLLDRLFEVLGQQVIEVASQLRVSRGPFMSKNPGVDYWNASGSEIYGRKEWRGGYSILTNTETSQKVEDVTDLLRVLKFTPGSYSVSQLTRSARRLL